MRPKLVGPLALHPTAPPTFVLQSQLFFRSEIFVTAARADVEDLLDAFANEWPRRRDGDDWVEPEPVGDEDDGMIWVDELGQPVAGPSSKPVPYVDLAADEDEAEATVGPRKRKAAGAKGKGKARAPSKRPRRSTRRDEEPEPEPAVEVIDPLLETIDEDVKPELPPEIDLGPLPADNSPKPFRVFAEIWDRLGWSRIHLAVVTALDRLPWFDTLSRLFLERITDANLVKRAAALFALYTFWGSQPLECDTRYVRIDPDSLKLLDHLPIDCAAAIDGKLPLAPDQLQPSLELHLILHALHTGSLLEAPRGTPQKPLTGSAFVLVPTELFIHPPLPSNRATDGKAELRRATAVRVLGARNELFQLGHGPTPAHVRTFDTAAKLLPSVKAKLKALAIKAEEDEEGDEEDEDDRPVEVPPPPKPSWAEALFDLVGSARAEAMDAREQMIEHVTPSQIRRARIKVVSAAKAPEPAEGEEPAPAPIDVERDVPEPAVWLRHIEDNAARPEEEAAATLHDRP